MIISVGSLLFMQIIFCVICLLQIVWNILNIFNLNIIWHLKLTIPVDHKFQLYTAMNFIINIKLPQ